MKRGYESGSASASDLPTPPPGRIVAGVDQEGPFLLFGPPEDVTSQSLHIRYDGDDYSWAVQERLYPQVREILADAMNALQEELTLLDRRLKLTWINN
jgi:hypothetical protein